MISRTRFESVGGESQRVRWRTRALVLARGGDRARPRCNGVRERGAVTVEAILVIPLMILVFVAVLYLHNVALARQLSDAQARSCAWAYASSGCAAIPEHCSERDFRDKESDLLSSAWDDAQDGGPSKLREKLRVEDVLENAVYTMIQPVVEALLGGDEFAVETSPRETERPIQLQGGVVRVSGYYALRCNLTAREPIDLLKGLWKEIQDELID